jgi:universal stress protein A
MSKYKNILVAVELKDGEDKIILNKAQELSKFYGGTLFLVHAVEHFSSFVTATAGMAVIALEESIITEHKPKLEKLAKSNHIADDNVFLSAGSIASAIHDVAKKINAGLIITGNHSRHGLALIFGSTLDSIIHHSDADVLAVHLPRK